MAHIERAREGEALRTYVFQVVVAREPDGRWSASCPALAGCASWGPTRDEALDGIREAVEAYAEDVVAAGEHLPDAARILHAPAVSVTV